MSAVSAEVRPADDGLRQARILILDDDVSGLSILQRMLERFGCSQIQALSDSTLFLETFDRFEPDLIVTDLRMPGFDGIQVIEAVRARLPKDSFLPVLVVTGFDTPSDKRRALAAGATDILHKPFDPSEMMMRIRQMVRARFMHQAIQRHNADLERLVAERTRDWEKAVVALKDSQRQLIQQERFRAFGEMAGGVVHDFNNALTTVIGYTELLLADEAMLDDKAQTREFLKTIHTAGRDASHVVSRLREFYRPREVGDLQAPVDLNGLLEEVVSLTRPKWKAMALDRASVINVHLDLERIPPVLGDGSELREVVTNLIFNAVDALPHGGGITLRTCRGADDIILEVTDNGTGMTPEVRERCLEPFFTTKGQKGTGLGLSMVFGVLQRHEAQAEIDSTVGKGTTFRIRFPVRELQPGAAESPEKMAVRSARILVVDDDEGSRDVTAKLLELDGHNIMRASSGAEALLLFLKFPIDLVLTDHGMPGMNGAQLAQHLRRKKPDVPIIMFTAYDVDPEKKPAGVDRIVPKPVSTERLRRAIGELLPAA